MTNSGVTYLAIGDGEVLCVIGAIEVVPSDAGLAPSHVPADDEVSAAVVLANNHMLPGAKGCVCVVCGVWCVCVWCVWSVVWYGQCHWTHACLSK